MHPLYAQLQQEIHEITMLEGVYDFLMRNDSNITLLANEVIDYNGKIKDMLLAKQKSLQRHLLTL